MAKIDLSKYGITGTTEVVYNPSYEMLFEEETKETLEGYEKGQVSELGAVNVMTGIYTGRSPKDRFIVDTPDIHDLIHWSNTNQPCSENTFNRLYEKMKDYAKDHQLFVTDALVGADPAYKLQIKCINEHAWHHLFLKQLFIRPKTKLTTPAEFTLICMPSVKANPIEENTAANWPIEITP